MSEATAFGRDLFMRHTDASGNTHVMQHRVWDAALFVASQQQAAQKVNEQQKSDEPRKARVEQITEQQYHQERKAK